MNKVLVTGATGFIGGRLVEKLLLDHGASVRALVRNFARASRLARFNLEMIGGDISDPAVVDQSVAGCDTVFHCAHDFKNPQRNLDGARVLADACLRHGVRRLVHVSSISVYEPLPDGEVDETTPSEPCGWVYPDNKLAVESMLLNFGADHGLPVVVLQPTIVYGPYSSWTMSPLERLRNGRVVLPSDKDGLCNPVYVDDVVSALILAAQKKEAVGERFLISGPDIVTWREFYATYERMLGVQSVVEMPAAEIQRMNRQSERPTSLSLLRQDPRRILKWGPVRSLYKFARGRLNGGNITDRVRKVLPTPLYEPDEVRLALYSARAEVKIGKANRLLGYEPAFDFERGMNVTEQFVKWANL